MYILLIIVAVLLVSQYFLWLQIAAAYEEKRMLKNILLTMVERYATAPHYVESSESIITQSMKEGNIDYAQILQHLQFSTSYQ